MPFDEPGMLNQNPAMILAGDAAALVLAWLACATVLRFKKAGSWRASTQRAFGLALVCLAIFLVLRQILPDLFVLPLVFVTGAAADILTCIRRVKPTDRYIVSVLASLSIVGVYSAVDAVLRVAGYHLTGVM